MLPGLLGAFIPGTNTTSRELSLPEPWFRYMAPTLTVGSQRISGADGRRGPVQLSGFKPSNHTLLGRGVGLWTLSPANGA